MSFRVGQTALYTCEAHLEAMWELASQVAEKSPLCCLISAEVLVSRGRLAICAIPVCEKYIAQPANFHSHACCCLHWCSCSSNTKAQCNMLVSGCALFCSDRGHSKVDLVTHIDHFGHDHILNV